MKSTNVRAITDRPVDEGVVRQLEELLAMAKNGQLVAISCAGELAGGNVIAYQAGNKDIARHLYALELTKLKLLETD